VPCLAVFSADEVNDDEVNDDEVNDDEVNDDEVNDDEVNDDEVNDDEVNDDEVNVAEQQGRPPRGVARFSRPLLLAVFASWALGQVFRDVTWLSGLLFYFPSPILALLLWAAAIQSFFRRRAKWALTFALLSIGPMAFVLRIENHFPGNGPRGNYASETMYLRAVHWNIYHAKLDWHKVRAKLDSSAADLIILSEAPENLSAADFPATNFLKLDSMVLISRFPLKLLSNHCSDNRLAYSIEWKPPRQSLVVLVADLPSSLLLARHPLLEELCELVESTRADLLFGDLNAPRRSLALSQLPPGYRHADDSVGTGWSYTWPSPLPVFALDHCIHGPKITPLAYHLNSSFASDHRLQVFDFRLK
jgi:vancomycin resistance protein VanJ